MIKIIVKELIKELKEARHHFYSILEATRTFIALILMGIVLRAINADKLFNQIFSIFITTVAAIYFICKFFDTIKSRENIKGASKVAVNIRNMLLIILAVLIFAGAIALAMVYAHSPVKQFYEAQEAKKVGLTVNNSATEATDKK